MTKYDYHIFKEEGVNIAVINEGDLGFLGVPLLGIQMLQQAVFRILDDSLGDPKDTFTWRYGSYVEEETVDPEEGDVHLQHYTSLDFPDASGAGKMIRRTILVGTCGDYTYFVKSDVEKLQEYSEEDAVFAGLKVHKNELVSFASFLDKVAEEFMNTLF